jgi:hypothetical protein
VFAVGGANLVFTAQLALQIQALPLIAYALVVEAEAELSELIGHPGPAAALLVALALLLDGSVQILLRLRFGLCDPVSQAVLVGVVATFAQRLHTTHGADGPNNLVLIYPDVRQSVSLAKYAAASLMEISLQL